MSENINSLFQTAQDDGIISPASANALSVVDIGQEIQEALTGNIDAVQSSEVVLVTMLPDDSGSIFFEGNSQLVCDGHNLVLEALDASKQADAIQVHTRYLNGHVLYPYSNVRQAVQMDLNNFDANGGTPLYDQSVLLLGTVLAQSQQFIDNGVAVRTVTLIITDGADLHSVRANASMVKSIVDDMLRTEDHIIAGMGIDDGVTDFNQVFKEMGIRED